MSCFRAPRVGIMWIFPILRCFFFPFSDPPKKNFFVFFFYWDEVSFFLLFFPNLPKYGLINVDMEKNG